MENQIVEKPVVIERTRNELLLSWKHNENENHTGEVSYTLQYKHSIDGWKTIYRGFSTRYKVCNLTPSDIHRFRLKAMTPEGAETPWSDLLKTSTLEEPVPMLRLIYAVQTGKQQLVKKLLKIRPELIDCENRLGVRALRESVLKNDLSMTSLLLNHGADVESPVLTTGRTVLMIAIYHGYLDVAEILIEKGADVNRKDINHCTSLHYAVDSNSLQSVAFVLQHGGDVQRMDNKRWTPLIRAVIVECDIEIVELLLEYKSNKEVKDINGMNCEDHALLNERHDLVELFRSEEIQVEEKLTDDL